MRPVHFFYNSLEQILFEQKRYSLKVFLEKVLREKSAPKMQCKQKHAANCNACKKAIHQRIHQQFNQLYHIVHCWC